jgi:hypothetical protein
MSWKRGRVLPVVAAAAVLVGGANLAAYAANGHPILLGGGNHAVGTTTVDNDGRGPAVMLRTRPGAPPLAVSSHHRVARLNADRIDGFHGTALRTRSWTYPVGGDNDEGLIVKAFPDLPPGYYLASYDVVAKLFSNGFPFTCWFTTPSQPKAVYGLAYQVAAPVVVSATGYVDATGPFTFSCRATPAFDTYKAQYNGGIDSTVTFTRLDTSSVRKPQSQVPNAGGR